MRARSRAAFTEGMNKVAGLCTRAPSGPVLVGGSPWSGKRLSDVAIVMSANNNVVRQHLRIARACADAGLDTVFVYSDLDGGYTPQPQSYAVSGVRIVKLPLRAKRAGLSYPNPLVLLTMLSELDSLFPRQPFGAVVTHIDQCEIFGLFVYWARRRGIPSFVVQEGMTGAAHEPVDPTNSPSRRPTARRLVSSLVRKTPHELFRVKPNHYIYSDYFCAYGEAAKRESIRLGRDPATVFVVGNPSFDHVIGMPAQRPIQGSNRTILYAEQHVVEPEKELRFFNELARICCDQNGHRLIIKLHPLGPWKAQDLEKAIPISEQRARLLQVISTGDIVDMMDDVDVLVTIHSTAAYHAFVKGIPVVTVDYLNETPFELDAYRYGGAIKVHNAQELAEAIHAASASEKIRRQLHQGAARVITEHLFKLDGQASRRIAEVIFQHGRGGLAGPKHDQPRKQPA